jgi:hypothetical protein
LPSPPTWACYEQIYGDEDYDEDEDSFSESGSDGSDDDGGRATRARRTAGIQLGTGRMWVGVGRTSGTG